MSITFKKVSHDEISNLIDEIKESFDNYKLVKNDHDYYIILRDDEFIGFMDIYKKELFQKFFIVKEERDKGLGKIVLEEAIKYFTQFIDQSQVYFYTKKTNERATHLFSKYGFEIVEEKDQLYKFKRIIPKEAP